MVKTDPAAVFARSAMKSFGAFALWFPSGNPGMGAPVARSTPSLNLNQQDAKGTKNQ